jgi:hypothetical protein
MSDARCLLESFAEIPDPRGKQGVRHPLPAMLALATVAMLSGCRSLEAIAQFGRDHGAWLAEALGFRRHKTPCKATYSILFRRLDVAVFEAKLAAWLGGPSEAAGRHVALDGKTLRGSGSDETPGLHLLAAFAPEQAAVLAQAPVPGKTNEHKAALELLKITPVRGGVVTADAMFCHRDFCQAVRDQEADYLVTVKDNQSNLKQDVESVLGRLPEDLSPLRSKATACRAEVGGHG